MLLGLVVEPGLQWEAPERCPSRADAAAYLRDELQQDPDAGEDAVVIEEADGRWRAEVRIEGGDRRELEADSCEDLMAAAMVVIAVSRVDAEPAAANPTPDLVPAPVEPAAPEPPPRPADPEPAAPQPVPATKSDPLESAPAPAWSHHLGLHAGVAAVLVPALSARLGARYELGAGRWALRLGAHYDTPRELLYPSESVGGRFQAASGDLSACWTPGRRALTGSLCAGAGGGGVFGVGVGIPDPQRPRAGWVGALASGGLRWAWSDRWRLAIDAGLSVGLRRPLFHVGAREPLFQSPRLGGSGTFAIEWRLR